MPPPIALNRRGFVKLAATAAAGLLIGVPLPGRTRPASAPVMLHPLIRVGSDGVVTLFAQNPEMGQGVKTALPMLIAEELRVDWASIRVDQADWIPGLDLQFSGGSLSVRLNFDAMRQAGAAAREMLIAAAARHWGRPAAELEARDGNVHDPLSGERIGYAEIAAAAALEPLPDEAVLSDPSAYRIVGRSMPDVDLDAMLTGRQEYSLDVRLPGMLYTVARRAPVGDAQPRAFDDRATRGLTGIVDVRMIRNSDYGGRIILPNCPNFVSGVAVTAESTWAALEGARRLEVEWQQPAEVADSNALAVQFERAMEADGTTIRDDGDVADAIADSHASIDVTYRLPFLAHVPMEPMNCTARWNGGHLELWAPTQNPSMAAAAAAKALGIEAEAVTVHVLRSGGAFGRRYYADFVVDTAILARDLGRPVKVVWPREDDVRHDYFRPASLQRVRAGVDIENHLMHWHHKVVSHAREIFLERDGEPNEISAYEFPAGFVPHLRYEYSAVPSRIPLGQWRAVEHSSNVFVVACAIDELAHASQQDPLELWLSLVGRDRHVQVLENFRFDASRLRHVIERVAARSRWGQPLPAGHGRGLAASYNQGAWVAEVAEVSVREDTVRVERITAVVDCGLVVNPGGALAQVEGAIIEGLSAALYGDITVAGGVVQQGNFHDYRLCRMHEVPMIDVEFVSSTEPPRGLGEPPLPPVAPAVANAIYAASGRRIRALPLSKHIGIA